MNPLLPRLLALLLLPLLPLPALAGDPSPPPGDDPRIIYGNDDRIEIHEITDLRHTSLPMSTAAMFYEPYGYLTQVSGGWEIDTSLLFQDYLSPLCPTEPYRDQPVPADCTGFMVGPDLIATAGHCIRNNTECDNSKFVFGFWMLDPFTVRSFVPDDDVYACQSIVGQVYTATDDWAVVQVDRPIVGHRPMPLRRTGAVEIDPEALSLVVIGHPVGLPMKLAGGATVQSATDPDYFEANLDVYGGNSGSPVMSLDPGGRPYLAEGILVRGNSDFVWTGVCYESRVCPDDTGCDGEWEESTRSTNFEALVPPLPPPGSVPDGASVPGPPLVIETEPGDRVRLEWGPACSPPGADYAIYRGVLGDFSNYGPVTCTTGGALSLAFDTIPGQNSFYLVVARYGYVEGSYGLTGAGLERPPSTFACLRQEIGGCP